MPVIVHTSAGTSVQCYIQHFGKIDTVLDIYSVHFHDKFKIINICDIQETKCCTWA